MYIFCRRFRFYFHFTILFLLTKSLANSLDLQVIQNRNMTIISVDEQTHIDYGLSYPLTYKFSIPEGIGNIKAYRKFQIEDNWESMEERTRNDFFNGIEVIRFDYESNIAFLSVGFSNVSDSIFLKITDFNENDLDMEYLGISEYYDNRTAVVTITADDWADYCNLKFVQACTNFRSFNLWYSVGVITGSGWLSNTSWNDIQNQIDLGLVEVVAHSRTHPGIPYIDTEGEVLGGKQDLIDNLDLSGHNSSGENEYIYAWVAPYGEYNSTIDTMTSIGKYLISRLFYWGDNNFSNWNNELNKFDPVGGSIEIGSSYYWGSTNIDELNETFDSVIDSNGVYHLMTHPNILEWNMDFTWDHLEYISNKKDIWYVGFGHLYLYRFLQNAYPPEHNLNYSKHRNDFPETFKLIQNYPNPFNPTTTLKYDLYKDSFVDITVYDMLGNVVNNLINMNQNSGSKSTQWNATNNQGEPVSAGVYLYKIQAGDFSQTKKMILLK